MSMEQPARTAADMSASDSEELAQQIQTQELSKKLEKWRPYLLRIAVDELDSQLRPKVAASDLVQQTLIQAHNHIGQFRGETEEVFKRWLRQILINQLADAADRYHVAAKRRLSAEIRLDSDSKLKLRESLSGEVPSPLDNLASQEQIESVQAAMSALPEDYRQVIELRNRDRMPFDEIGQLLNRSADAARLLWYRALKRLEQELPSDSP